MLVFFVAAFRIKLSFSLVPKATAKADKTATMETTIENPNHPEGPCSCFPVAIKSEVCGDRNNNHRKTIPTNRTSKTP